MDNSMHHSIPNILRTCKIANKDIASKWFTVNNGILKDCNLIKEGAPHSHETLSHKGKFPSFAR